MNPTHATITYNALRHIQKCQSLDGSFKNVSGFDHEDLSDGISRHTTFFTATILNCLRSSAKSRDPTQDAAARFLLSQKNDAWSFNYWARDTDENRTLPYPDDLDDTFTALAALVRYIPSYIGGEAFAALAKLLIALEAQEGGPYRTWIVNASAPLAWRDIDPVVNSTIGYFLSSVGVHLPNLTRFVDAAVRENRITSPYYPGIFHVGYFFSRFYNALPNKNIDARQQLARVIEERLMGEDGKKATPLECSMAISSLVNLGRADAIPSWMIDSLIKKLAWEGFRPYAFCIDPTRDGKRSYAGSSALTAAFCAEALALCAKAENAAVPKEIPATIPALKAACATAGTELRSAALAEIGKISDGKIALLAYEFQAALGKDAAAIPSDIIASLSLGNLYGWAAYSIYDDVMDDESDASLIPYANFFLRSVGDIYATLDGRIQGARELFKRIMDRVDDANAWEQNHCRIPAGGQGTLPKNLPLFNAYERLADRSIGHAMGPLAELLFLGYDPGSEECRGVELMFHHYLIARQLHDDAHDWIDDLLRGRMTSIGTLVARRFRKQCPERATNASITEIIPALKKIFWEEVIDETVDVIRSHIVAARHSRERSHLFHNAPFLEIELKTLETGAARAVKDRDEALLFLKYYSASRPSGAPAQNPLP